MINKNKTQKDIDAANQWHSYRMGWIKGANVSAMEPKFTEHDNPLIVEAYNLGYGDGRKARNEALVAAESRYGYKQEILRLAGDADVRPPTD
jgi:hypothetical protein